MNGNKRIKKNGEDKCFDNELLRCLKAVKILPNLFHTTFPEYFPIAKSPFSLLPIKEINLEYRTSVVPNQGINVIVVRFFPHSHSTVGTAPNQCPLIIIADGSAVPVVTQYLSPRLLLNPQNISSFIRIKTSCDQKLNFSISSTTWTDNVITNDPIDSDPIQTTNFIWRSEPNTTHAPLTCSGVAITISGLGINCNLFVRIGISMEGECPINAQNPPFPNFKKNNEEEASIQARIVVKEQLFQLLHHKNNALLTSPLKNPYEELFPFMDLSIFDQYDDVKTFFSDLL